MSGKACASGPAPGGATLCRIGGRYRRAGLAASALAIVLSGLPACVGGRCRPRDAACQEWVLVLVPGADAESVARWLEQRGHAVGKVLPDLRLVHVWLQRGAVGAAAVREIRAQPFTATLTDQAVPVPSVPG